MDEQDLSTRSEEDGRTTFADERRLAGPMVWDERMPMKTRELVPRSLAVHSRLLPLSDDGENIRVAVADEPPEVPHDRVQQPEIGAMPFLMLQQEEVPADDACDRVVELDQQDLIELRVEDAPPLRQRDPCVLHQQVGPLSPVGL